MNVKEVCNTIHTLSIQIFIAIKKVTTPKQKALNALVVPSYRRFWKMFPRPIPPRPRPLAATAGKKTRLLLIKQQLG